MEFNQSEFEALMQRLEDYASQVSKLKTQLEMQPEIESLKKEMDMKQAELNLKQAELDKMTAERDDLAGKYEVQTQHGKELEEKATEASVENIFLKKFLILSAERIKEFMKTLKTMREWSFVRTFVEWSLPEKYRQEQKQLMDEIMGLPINDDNNLPKVLMDHPTFEGPMFDVHHNDDVKLTE